MSFPDLPLQFALGQVALPGFPAAAALPNIGVPKSGVRGAIAQAAQATGMDFSYLLGQARLESGLNPTARAATSSATGLYQFTNATWAQTLARHGAALGVSAQALADPASRAQLMGLRNDPQASALMAAAMAGDNQATLTGALGRPPSSGELYLAHFLGPDGAVKFLSGLASDPSQSAAGLFPKAASANRAVFFDASGAPRSLAQVMGLLGNRLASAMEDGGGQDSGVNGGSDQFGLAGLAMGSGGLGLPAGGASGIAAIEPIAGGAAPTAPTGGPIAQEFASLAAQSGGQSGDQNAGQPTSGSSAWGGSMADTLRATFGADASASGASTPDFIRSAYGRMQALGL